MSFHRRMVRWARSAFRGRVVAVTSVRGTRTFRLFGRRQFVMVVGVAGVSIWAVAATIALIIEQINANRQIDDLELGYANLIVDVAGRAQGAVAATEALARHEAQTDRLAVENAALAEQVQDLSGRYGASEAARLDLERQYADLSANLNADIAVLEGSLSDAVSRTASLERELSGTEQQLETAEAGHITAVAVAQAAGSRADDLAIRLADAEERNDSLSDRVDAMSAAVVTAFGAVEMLEVERDGLRVALGEQRAVSADLESHLLSALAAAVDLSAERDDLLARSASLSARLVDVQSALAGHRGIHRVLEGALQDATARIEELSSERALLLTQSESRNVEISSLGDELAVLRDDLLDTQLARAALEGSLFQSEAIVAQLSDERQSLIEQTDALNSEVAFLQGNLLDYQLAATTLEDALYRSDAAVDHLSAERDALRAESGSLSRELVGLRTELEEQTAARVELEGIVRSMVVVAADLSTERDTLRDDNGVLIGQVGALESRISNLAAYQEEVFAQLRDAIDDHVFAVEEGLAVTGLDIEAIIEDIYGAEFYGTGGPLIPLLDEQIAGQPGWIDAVASINLADRAIELRDVANQLPIGFPVDPDTPISSPFGPRRDPFTGAGAMHQGLDFDGDYGDLIHASGPGTIIRAEWYSGYGRTVDIDHGFGLVSRYAHLQEILVEEGQSISYNDQIGLMGSSGRSTGSHLHYEVLVNGVPYDPMNFILAGEHVYEVTAGQDNQ
ncbi:MAG: peptidoglycan DD-metalloendopeptidase family protein [Pseudomonadota bacterium]